MTTRPKLPPANDRPNRLATRKTATGMDRRDIEKTGSAPETPTSDDRPSRSAGRQRILTLPISAQNHADASAGSHGTDEAEPDEDAGDDAHDANEEIDGNDGFVGDPDEAEPRDGTVAELLAQSLVAGHFVMDRSAIVAALAAAGFDGTFDHLSSGEEQRARTLVQYRDARLFRPHLVASTRTAARLGELDRAAPNFSVVTRLVRRAAQVSLIAGAPIRLQPIVLLGSPGIGKSRYATLLAAALGTSCHLVNGSTLPDVGSLTGYPPVWRGSGPGRLAKFILSSPTSGPLIVVDEAEKIADFEAMTHPLDRLLPILERDTAAAFQDENLQVPMRAQHALFIFACNSLDTLSMPFKNRVLIIRVPDLDPIQRDAVLEAMLSGVARDLGLPMALASRAALAPLRLIGMRRCRLAFEIAVGLAVEQERRFLTATDLAAAVAMLDLPDRCSPMGFVPQGEAERG